MRMAAEQLPDGRIAADRDGRDAAVEDVQMASPATERRASRNIPKLEPPQLRPGAAVAPGVPWQGPAACAALGKGAALHQLRETTCPFAPCLPHRL